MAKKRDGMLRVISWLVGVYFLDFNLLFIWYFVIRYVNIEELRWFLQLPPAELAFFTRTFVKRAPLPESYTGPYMHLPNTRWIRLCKIHRSKDGGGGYTLQRFRLDAAPPYRALSYTWGPADGVSQEPDGNLPPSTEISGRKRTLTWNLAWALLQFGDLNMTTTYYWIDAICIDQLNIQEKSEQASIMDRICQRAEAVNVWIGRKYQDTAIVNNHLVELADLYQEQNPVLPESRSKTPMWATGPEIMPHNRWETLVETLSRRWFHRMWTL